MNFFYCPHSATLQNSIGILLQLHINILENSTWNKLLILIPVQYIHIHIFTQTKNFFQPHHEGLFSCKTLHMVFTFSQSFKCTTCRILSYFCNMTDWIIYRGYILSNIYLEYQCILFIFYLSFQYKHSVHLNYEVFEEQASQFWHFLDWNMRPRMESWRGKLGTIFEIRRRLSPLKKYV